MCVDPATMFVITTVAGSALSAAGSISQGESAAQAGQLQQEAYNQQAKSDATASAFEQMKERRKQEANVASARAQVGASGVALTGSPTEVMLAQAEENQLDLETIKHGSKVRQDQLLTQGKIARYSGQQSQTAGYIGAATNFVSGISSLYDPRRAVKFGKSPFQ